MDARDFVHVIEKVVTESSLRSIEEIVTTPPGKSPSKDLISLSIWFNDLPEDQKENVRRVMKRSVDEAVFGFLCVLDGVRAIEGRSDKGKLLLYYEREGDRKLLNGADELLHDMYMNY